MTSAGRRFAFQALDECQPRVCFHALPPALAGGRGLGEGALRTFPMNKSKNKSAPSPQPSPPTKKPLEEREDSGERQPRVCSQALSLTKKPLEEREGSGECQPRACFQALSPTKEPLEEREGSDMANADCWFVFKPSPKEPLEREGGDMTNINCQFAFQALSSALARGRGLGEGVLRTFPIHKSKNKSAPSPQLSHPTMELLGERE